MNNIKLFYLKNLLACFLIAISSAVFGTVKLPRLISDGMVLQRNNEIKVWGWADPGEKISLHFLNLTYNAEADKNGEWNTIIKPLKEGGPYEMKIIASNTIIISDILIGDIWVCSGQSNMELAMKRVKPLYQKEIENADNSEIRQFAVPQKYNFNLAMNDLKWGEWKKANPENVLEFSAVAYFFASEIYEKYKIPIGIINVSLGGSPAEAWMSEGALKKFPVHYEEAQKFKDSLLIRKIETEDQERISAWYKLLNQKDEGIKNLAVSWRDPTLNTADWKKMKVPSYWADTDLGSVNGAVWFRKDFQLNSSAAGKEAKLDLGRIVDADSVFINHVFVGTTSYQYPPRWYNVPAGVLKEGKNTIVIRVINNSGNGGFVLDKPYEIKCEGQTIDLKGDWQFKLGAKMDPLVPQTFIRWKPVGLYNAMINPLLNYRIKGVIWYQGESNTGGPEEYAALFPAMIADWRTNWKQGDFPFLFVQLANFMEAKKEPGESNWASLRDSQLKALSVPNTGMAVTIDLGEWNDIHPLNKKDVGKRLALEAMRVAYKNKKIVSSGPLFKSLEVKGNKIIITFDHTGSGLLAKGSDMLSNFSIAGNDKKFIWAKAKIEKNKVIVWSDKITNPVAVRYAWADNPEGANLYNKEGLPASPFRTDK